MIRKWTAILLLVFASSAGAQEIRELMRDAGDTMLRMLPSVYSDEPDRVLLAENLVRLDYLFKQAEPHLKQRQAGAAITYELMRDRLREAIELAPRRNVGLMKSAVVDAFELCSSCHTQDHQIKPAFGVSKLRELDEFLAAEFSYLTRDYDGAMVSYRNYFESEDRSAKQDLAALEHMLIITADVKADPVLAATELKALGPALRGNATLARRVSAWTSLLDRVAAGRDGVQSPLNKTTVKAMDHYLRNEWPAIEATLDWQAREAHWIVVRGQLNSLMTAAGNSPELPRLLYWLAVSDRALHYRFFDSLSRAYLERCIEGYPSHPYARECLDEYEMLALVSFSGSGGTRIPAEVQDRLQALRRLVYHP